MCSAPEIAVFGSINMDFVTRMERFPKPGETVIAQGFARFPGGKGANQAVAAARMGGQVSFYGKVGADVFGEEILSGLRDNGVSTEWVLREDGTPSGIASIWVVSDGENAIAYTPGANARVDTDYIDRVINSLSNAKVLLLQLEVPSSSIAYLLRRLPVGRPLVILNPAPAQNFGKLKLKRVDIITPNRGELVALTDESRIERAAETLLTAGVKTVICTDGREGAYLIDKEHIQHFNPFSVDPVDTTAAGDAFNGALAAALAKGRSVEEAVLWANAAGALATTRRGAQPSLPTATEVETLLHDSPVGP